MVGLSERISERIIPAAKVFLPVLDDIYELSTAAPTPLDATHRQGRRPKPWSRSTGTTICRNSFSISTIRSWRRQTIARAASSFDG
jgi:hypothetical protein